MPWLTPEEIPEDTVCRVLFIPDDAGILGDITGALLPLIKVYNWEAFGAVTPEEMAARMQEMFYAFLDSTGDCATCETPDGTPFFRVGLDGLIEQYEDGEWVTPTGDYAIPAIPAREEPTPEQRICLAAKNAANTLATFYEELTDAYATDIDPAFGIAALLLAVGIALAFPFAPIVGAILLFAELPFAIFYATIETVGSDFWDTDFTDRLVCLLIDAATDTAGVVTFDLETLITLLGDARVLLEPTATAFVLYGQVDFLLRTIGEDGLNQAGATTAITDDDCEYCEEEHCFEIDFRLTDGSAFGVTMQGGTYVPGTGWVGAFFSSLSQSNAFGYWAFPDVFFTRRIEMDYTKEVGSGGNNVNQLNALEAPVTSYNVTAYGAPNNDNTFGVNLLKQVAVEAVIDGMGAVINTGGSAGNAIIIKWTVVYSGEIPEGWSDNCED